MAPSIQERPRQEQSEIFAHQGIKTPPSLYSTPTMKAADPLSPTNSTSGRTSPGPSTLAVPEKTNRRRQWTDSSNGSTSSQAPPNGRHPQSQLNNVYSAADEYSIDVPQSSHDGQTRDPLGLAYNADDDDGGPAQDMGFGPSPGWLRHGSTEHLYSPNGDEDGYSGGRIGSSSGRDGLSDDRFRSKYDPYVTRGRAQSGMTNQERSRSQQTDDGNEEDDQRDAAQVEQNLERWAAAERQRRKAARTSRSFADNAGSGSGGSLVRKFSQSLNKGTKREGLPNGQQSYGAGGARRNGSGGMHKDSLSISSSSADSTFSEAVTAITNGSSRGSVESIGLNGISRQRSGSNPTGRSLDVGVTLENVPENEDDDDLGSATLSPSSQDHHTDRKGKGKATDSDAELGQSPFADPSNSPTFGRTSGTIRSNKPTAARPIVTVGRAPSVRRTPVSTPKIVATDVDGRTTMTSSGDPQLSKNPFLSKSEAAAAAASSKRISEEVEEELDVTSLASRGGYGADDSMEETMSRRNEGVKKERPTSLASLSKFREIGLDSTEEDESAMTRDELLHRQRLRRAATSEGDDTYSDDGATAAAQHSPTKSLAPSMTNRWSTHIGPQHSRTSDRLAREAEEDRRMIREGKGRQPWWTEWLCGCGRVVDEDNEQSGKTMPE